MFQKDKRISRGYMEGNHLIYCRIYKTKERSYFNICTKRIVNNVLSKCKKEKKRSFVMVMSPMHHKIKYWCSISLIVSEFDTKIGCSTYFPLYDIKKKQICSKSQMPCNQFENNDGHQFWTIVDGDRKFHSSLIFKSHLRTNIHFNGFLSQIPHQLDMLSKLNVRATSWYLQSMWKHLLQLKSRFGWMRP